MRTPLRRSPRPSWLYSVIAVLSWPVLRVVFRHRAEGRHLLPQEGGFVLAANHWSNFDPWLLGIPLFPRRFLRFMAKSELFWFPLGTIVTACGAFPVRRGTRDEGALAKAVELCREGNVVVMFPEGTRRRKGLRKKHEARWRSGAARIALRASVPLVPAAVAGTDRLARLGPLRVAYGAPIALDDLSTLELDEAAAAATERLREAVLELERSLA
ncbi:MAG: 1-acyl-sn-glycerol-3-phosphate acyltransferase [Actinobacteria bacterium]|nr:1-acyl-sn-glycerol-3-phosphate acyltransferase [Actinomycetota bacterium]